MLKIGVVGGNHGLVHVRNVLDSERAEIEALCSRTGEFPDWISFAPMYSNIDKFLDNHDFSAFVLAAPHFANKHLFPKLIRSGKPILVEKPVGCSSDEIRQFISDSEESDNQSILVGYHRRFSERLGNLKNILDSGEIGEVKSFALMWCVKKNEDYFEVGKNKWKGDKFFGGGFSMINLSHEFDTLRYLFGDIDDITGIVRKKRFLQLEDSACLTLGFSCGIVGSIVASDALAGPYSYERSCGENPKFPHFDADHFLIFGSAATLAFPSFTLYYGEGDGDWHSVIRSKSLVMKPSSVDPLKAELDHFFDVVDGKVMPSITLRDALSVMELVEETERIGGL